MDTRIPTGHRSNGFTILELIIAVTIIGIIASAGLPMFMNYQLRSKSAEVKANLAAIRVVQEARFSQKGSYLPAVPEPPVVPGKQRVPFNFTGSDFFALGWSPEGQVHFSYAIAVTGDSQGYTADAAGDLDADGILQNWGYAKPSPAGALIDGVWGCVAATMTLTQIDPCHGNRSIF